MHPADGAQLATDLEDRVFELSCLGVIGAALRRDLGVFLFIFDLRGIFMSASTLFVHTAVRYISRRTYRDFKVNHLVREGGHFIVETESVLASLFGSEDKVSLPLLLTR